MFGIAIRRFFATFCLGLLGGAAFACEPPVYDAAAFAKADKPLRLLTDGSFENASADLVVLGYPVRDRGNSRIAQKLEYRGWCGPSEQLLVVDCSTADLVVLLGKPGPNSFNLGLGLSTTIDQIQKPIGPIEITSESTIPNLIKIAQQNDIEYYTDYVARQKQDKRKNRHDAYYGCRLFYPDSAGAKMPKP